MTAPDKYNIKIDDFSIASIAESGQCFRIVPDGFNSYSAIAMGHAVSISLEEDGSYTFSCSRETFEDFWKGYFDLGKDYGEYRKIVLEDDEYLKTAVEFGSGIRILNQDPWEMLISFIISQRKSVPAIRTSIERLSDRYGKPIDDGHKDFPDALSLAKAKEEDLRACGLGYRTEYVSNAAKLTALGSLDLGALSNLSTHELIDKLMELKGVGIKVASCIALFGYHRLDTVPVDVWMKRVIETVYNGTLPKEYAPYAGVMQQYMFNYARINKVGI